MPLGCDCHYCVDKYGQVPQVNRGYIPRYHNKVATFCWLLCCMSIIICQYYILPFYSTPQIFASCLFAWFYIYWIITAIWY